MHQHCESIPPFFVVDLFPFSLSPFCFFFPGKPRLSVPYLRYLDMYQIKRHDFFCPFFGGLTLLTVPYRTMDIKAARAMTKQLRDLESEIELDQQMRVEVLLRVITVPAGSFLAGSMLWCV